MCHRSKRDDLFVAKYGRAKIRFSSWREANKAAAVHILQQCKLIQKLPLICYSGGLDSEIVLVAFLEARKEVDPQFQIDVATLILEGDTNRHDIEFVDRFRNRLADLGHSTANLHFHHKKLDALKYWESADFLELAKETQIVSPIVICQAWLCGEMLKMDSRFLPIIGQGEIHLVKDTPQDYQPGVSPYVPSSWSIVETENLCGLYRYFLHRGLPAVPGFFQYMPEQFETQLRTNPVIHELVSHMRVGKLGTRTSKREIVTFDYPELEVRPKYHGFEPIEAEHDVWRKRLHDLMPECEGHWYQDFYSLYRKLRPEVPGIFQHQDWSYALGRDGKYFQCRRDEDDIFTTQWKDTANPRFGAWKSPHPPSPIGSSQENFAFEKVERQLLRFLKMTGANALVHDGSMLAKWLHALSPSLRILGASMASRLRPQDALAEILKTDLVDSRTLLVLSIATAAKKQSEDSKEFVLLVPRLHSRVEAEYVDTWIESEREARMSFALRREFIESELALPFCDSEIASALVECLNFIGPTNWQSELARRVKNLEALSPDIDFSTPALQAEAALRRIDASISALFGPGTATMNSSITLPSSNLEIGPGLDGASETFIACGLSSISIDDWLVRAKFAAPDLKLGGNLFYRQTVHGRELISEKFRQAFALKSSSGETLCTACVQILDPSPSGTLRIRGVTTEPGVRNRGHAKEFLVRLSRALCESKTLCQRFSKVEVWAAPEITSSFIAAGFVVSTELRPREELVYKVSENKLVPSGRFLQPMLLSLARESTR